MNRIIIITAMLLFATITMYAQQLEVDSNTVYKDTSGIVISKEKFNQLVKSGSFNPKPTKVDGGNIKEFTLTKMTEADKAMMKKMMAGVANYSKTWKGKKAPDFVAKDLNDNEISLSGLKGKVVVLKFWFTACHPCLDEMPALNKMIENKYKDNKNVVFLAPCLDDKKEVINKTLNAHPFDYNTLYNARDISGKYGVVAYPTHVVIDKNGIVTMAGHLGGDGTQLLEKAIDEALSGKKLSNKKRK